MAIGDGRPLLRVLLISNLFLFINFVVACSLCFYASVLLPKNLLLIEKFPPALFVAFGFLYLILAGAFLILSVMIFTMLKAPYRFHFVRSSKSNEENYRPADASTEIESEIERVEIERVELEKVELEKVENTKSSSTVLQGQEELQPLAEGEQLLALPCPKICLALLAPNNETQVDEFSHRVEIRSEVSLDAKEASKLPTVEASGSQVSTTKLPDVELPQSPIVSKRKMEITDADVMSVIPADNTKRGVARWTAKFDPFRETFTDSGNVNFPPREEEESWSSIRKSYCDETNRFASSLNQITGQNTSLETDVTFYSDGGLQYSTRPFKGWRERFRTVEDEAIIEITVDGTVDPMKIAEERRKALRQLEQEKLLDNEGWIYL